MCDKLLTAGAKAGGSPQVIRFSRALVADAVDRAPSEVMLADRRATSRKLAAGGEPAVWSAPGMYLLQGDVHRPFASHDMCDWARLLDQLPHVHGVFGLSMDDIPPGARDVVGLRLMAEHTTKHVRVLCFTPDGAEMLCRMKQIVGS